MIINFNLQKILVDRKKDVIPNKNVEAKNNLKIENVEEKQLKPLTNDKALIFSFNFNVDYKPDVASVNMMGSVTYMADEKVVKDVLAEWKKNKKINPKLSVGILNHILAKCNVRALHLEQEVNLPPHVPFPRIAPKEESKGK